MTELESKVMQLALNIEGGQGVWKASRNGKGRENRFFSRGSRKDVP